MAIDGRLSEAWPNDDSYSSTVLATIGLPTGTSGNTLAQANPTGTVTNERNFSSTSAPIAGAT